MIKYIVFTVILLTMPIVSFSANILKDPAIQQGDYSKNQRDSIRKLVNSLKKSDSKCVRKFKKDYQKSLFDYCEANGNGKLVGGGCEHVAYAWSLHTAVTIEALKNCKIEFSQSLENDA